jgi:hypothetical protein
MAWTNPVNPVGGTVITVTYAVTNILEPLRWLRLMTGNADPPGTAYVAISDSVSAVTWKKIPTDAIADGAVTSAKLFAGAALGNLADGSIPAAKLAPGAAVANIGYTPVSTAGGTLTGELAAPSYAVNSGGSLWRWSASGPSTFFGVPALINPIELQQSGSIHLTGPVTVNGNQVIDTSNDDTICHAASAATAANATQVGGRTPSATPAANAIPIADGAGKLDAWITGGATPGPHTHSGDALLPASLNGAPTSSTPGAGRIPIADVSGKIDAWVTPASFSIPSGLGMWVRTAAEIPAGFVRETSLDGLIPVGAGTTFGQTFTETTSYGSSWAHSHSVPSLGVSLPSLGVTVSSVSVSGAATGGPSDNTGASSAINGLATAGGVNLNTTGHTHPLNGVSLAVSASGTGSGTTAAGSTATGAGTSGSTAWLPPMRAVVWCRKT